MHGSLSTIERPAISFGVKAGVKSDADDQNWFSDASWKLYPTKPGTSLYLITQRSDTEQFGTERLCQKYAAGDVRPSAYFLRRLLRSDHGEPWLAAAMDGCTASWWRDLENARALCLRFKIEPRER